MYLRSGYINLFHREPPLGLPLQDAGDQVHTGGAQIIWHFEVPVQDRVLERGNRLPLEWHRPRDHKIK